MSATFEELGLSPELLKSIEDMGFEEPSPIQLLAIPPLLAGRDVMGQAQTGTGKTAAFGLPILEKVVPDGDVQAIILCPTRELAIQVAEELGRLSAHRRNLNILPIYGGQPIERQLRALARGVQIVVGTPGRVIDHLERGTLKLDGVRIAVLDEADEMLDMGFREDIEAILDRTPPSCQKVMFSATMRGPILELGKRFLQNPELLRVTHKVLTVPAIEQIYYEVRPYQKMDALCRVLDSQGFRKALVFCSTKRGVDEVTAHLQGRGYQADGLHGNLAQPQRDRVMTRFRSGALDVLVATDVAARGIDVDDVDAVINYDIPRDVESYVHRIGRTGRAGREGRAFTFVTMRENSRLREIIRYTGARISRGSLPTLRDVANIRTTRLLDEVRRTLEKGALERWLMLVDEFLAGQFPDGAPTSADMAAAMLKMLMQRDFGDQDIAQGGEDWVEQARESRRKGPAEGRERPSERRTDAAQRSRERMCRIRISAGREQGVSPREIVGAITGECGIPGRLIGAIDIREHFSMVDIAENAVELVLAGISSGIFIGGSKVTAARTEGKGSPRIPRRQYSGKMGKKPRGATTGRKLYRDPTHRPETDSGKKEKSDLPLKRSAPKNNA